MATSHPPTPQPSKPGKEVSVMAWIEDEFGKVLMVKQRRGRKLWTLPGGKVRAREALVDALGRELYEETGLHIRRAELAEFYDRHEKSNLTVLFRVIIREGTPQPMQPEEIESLAFRASPPKNSTPSLSYFWNRLRKAGDNFKSKA